MVPSDLTVQKFCECTVEEEVSEAVERLTQCETCPERGGTCQGKHHQGQGPKWTMRLELNEPGIVWGNCSRWRIYVLDQKMIGFGFPAKMISKTLDGYEIDTDELRTIARKIRSWVVVYERFREMGKGIALLGDSGIGKTHLVVAVCRILLEQRRISQPRFWDFTHLMSILRAYDDGSRRAIREAMECELLVLDDLNMQRITDWVCEQVGLIINHRWSNNLVTIVTSNDMLESYEQMLGRRTISRIQDMVLSFDWAARDRRDKRG